MKNTKSINNSCAKTMLNLSHFLYGPAFIILGLASFATACFEIKDKIFGLDTSWKSGLVAAAFLCLAGLLLFAGIKLIGLKKEFEFENRLGGQDEKIKELERNVNQILINTNISTNSETTLAKEYNNN